MASSSSRLLLLLLLTTILTLNTFNVTANSTKIHLNQTEPKSELQLLQVIARHGDRTPYWLYKKDHYKESDFWEGVGNLVNRGKDRIFNYGRILRQRYSSYFDNMLPRNIHAQSSPIRRCLETNLALLAGMFPPKNQTIWSDSNVLPKIWQPIAVETVEEDRAWKLNPDATCPAATKIEKDMETSVPELRKFLQENHEFMKKVGNYTGEDYFKLTWLYVGYLFDTLASERDYFGKKYVQPDWLDKIGNDTLARLSKFNDMVYSIFGQAPEFIKLRSGTFLKEMISNLRNASHLTEMTPDTKQLFTYTSHDTMIAYIMHALGMFNGEPTYGSGLIIELRKSHSISNVHLYYANVTNNFDIYPLKLNESSRFSARCKQSYCCLDDFAASLADYLEYDVERDCQKMSPTTELIN